MADVSISGIYHNASATQSMACLIHLKKKNNNNPDRSSVYNPEDFRLLEQSKTLGFISINGLSSEEVSKCKSFNWIILRPTITKLLLNTTRNNP